MGRACVYTAMETVFVLVRQSQDSERAIDPRRDRDCTFTTENSLWAPCTFAHPLGTKLHGKATKEQQNLLLALLSDKAVPSSPPGCCVQLSEIMRRRMVMSYIHLRLLSVPCCGRDLGPCQAHPSQGSQRAAQVSDGISGPRGSHHRHMHGCSCR